MDRCLSSILSPCAQLVKLQFCLPTYQGLMQLPICLQQHLELLGSQNTHSFSWTMHTKGLIPIGSVDTRSIIHGPSSLHTIISSFCTRGKGESMQNKHETAVYCCRMLSQCQDCFITSSLETSHILGPQHIQHACTTPGSSSFTVQKIFCDTRYSKNNMPIKQPSAGGHAVLRTHTIPNFDMLQRNAAYWSAILQASLGKPFLYTYIYIYLGTLCYVHSSQHTASLTFSIQLNNIQFNATEKRSHLTQVCDSV